MVRPQRPTHWLALPGLRSVLALMALMALLALATGCASTPAPTPLPPGLLADDQFQPPAEAPRDDDLFTVSEAMRSFLREKVERAARRSDPANALVDALNSGGRIRLDYDASRTRTAAQAFEDGRGNCLSLLLMASAMARELGLRVTFYNALLEDNWTRSDQLLVASGHVNVGLGRPQPGSNNGWSELLIDFLPAADLRRLVLRPIDENTVVALYQNNRAVEALQDKDLDSAYAWARAALQRHGQLPHALNTLGVIYLRRGLPQQAQVVFDHLLARLPESAPAHRHALANQVQAMLAQGRADEASALRQRLARLEPRAPLQALDEGLAALRAGDPARALPLLRQQLRLDPDNAQARHWLAVALWTLGDTEQAQRELQRAALDETSPKQRALYQAKLQRLRQSQGTQLN